MLWAKWLVEALIVINFVSFTLLSGFLFRLDKAGLVSYTFFVGFLAATGTSVYVLHHHSAQPLWMMALGAVAALASGCFFVTAARVIRSKPLTAIFSPDTPEFVHTSGPYAFVRHPFYSAYILNFLAAYLASAHPVCFGLFVASFVVYGSAARVEENKFAKSSIAAQYQQYRERTGMFFFRLGQSR